MKRIIIAILLIFIAGPVFGASTTYYISPLGSNTSPYDTWAKAANQPNTAISAGNGQAPTATTVGAGHKYYMAPGEYTGYFDISNANQDGCVVQGTSAHGAITPATYGQVLINRAGANVVISRANVTMNNISATSGTGAYDLFYINGATGFRSDGLYGYNAGRYLLRMNNATDFVMTRPLMLGSDTTSPIWIYGTSSGSINYWKFGNSTTKSLSTATSAANAVAMTQSGVVSLNNGVGYGFDWTFINMNNAEGTTNLINSYVGNGRLEGTRSVTQTAGTLNVQTTYQVPSYDSNHYNQSGTVTDGGGNLVASQYSPLFTRHGRSGYFLPMMDDVTDLAANLSYATDVKELLKARGQKGTLFLTGTNLVYGVYNYLSNLQTLVSDGTLGIAIHGYTHVPYDLTSFGTVTKAGQTFTVNRATNEITTSDASVTITGFRAKVMGLADGSTVNSIAKAFVDGGWVVTYAEDVGTNKAEYNHGEILADGVAATDLTLLIDTTNTGGDITGFFKDQVYDFKTWLEANITGLTVTCIGGPGGRTSADSETAIKNMGFSCNRNWDTDDSLFLASHNVYKTSVRQSETLRNATASADTVALAEWMSTYGTIMGFNSHTTADTTIAGWTAILNTLAKYPEITVTDFPTACAAIYAAPWSTADDITYTRTWTDLSDYRLRSGSPAINAGTDLCATLTTATDLQGWNVCVGGAYVGRGAAPEIGAYEFRPSGGSFPFGFNFYR